MAQFEVSTGKLTEEAAQLMNLKRQFESEVTAMRSMSARYLNMWEGESKQAFANSVNTNMNLLNMFSNNLDKFSETLTKTATIYDNAEKNAVRIASNKGQ